jgi:hypothetical protein
MEGEDEFYRGRGYRKKSSNRDAKPKIEFPKLATISATNIAYLHVHCGKQPGEIVAAYPKLVTLAEIHLALADYYRNRETFEAEFARGNIFLAKDALSDNLKCAPKIRPLGLVNICGYRCL